MPDRPPERAARQGLHRAGLVLFAAALALGFALTANAGTARAPMLSQISGITATGLASWNPNVACTADLVNVSTVMGTAYPNEGLSGSPYQTGSTTGGIPDKRALSPPCTITNVNGQTLSSFVEIDHTYVYGYWFNTGDCANAYAPVNGGGSYPNKETLCDNMGYLRQMGTTNGKLVFEFDRDWLAKGYCGPSVPSCNNVTLLNEVSSGSISLDIQGFVFWNQNLGWWEIHELTAWRLSTGSTPPPPQGLASWNPNVSCKATAVKVSDVLGSSYPNQNLGGSAYQTSSTTGGVPDKRALSPPCWLTNVNGQNESTFVQISGVYLADYTFASGDCSTTYAAVNGGGSYPNGETVCDNTGDVYAVGTTNGFIHVEFDHDWLAKGYCGSSVTVCNNVTIQQEVSSGSISLDLQGFVYWDPGPSHWEIHPFTGWKLSSSGTPLSAAASASPSSAQVGATISFSCAASGGTSPYSYAWAFGDGATATGANASHAYSSSGTFTATCTVTDSASSTASASTTVTISAAPAPLSASASASPTAAQVNQSITFACTGSGGKSPYTYAWAFGDGTTGSGSSVTHAYAVTGNYSAKCTVTDSAAATANASVLVTITSAPPALPSWNPNVSCSATAVNITTVMGPTYPNPGLTGDVYQTGSGTGGVPDKRALSPPCTITNVNGQSVSSLVELDHIEVWSYWFNTGDCANAYAPVNGGGSYPNKETLCDNMGYFRILGATGGNLVFEFDRDWLAKGYCGPAVTACNNVTILQEVSSGSIPVDVQGFVYWNANQQWWEIHPLTAWRLSSASKTPVSVPLRGTALMSPDGSSVRRAPAPSVAPIGTRSPSSAAVLIFASSGAILLAATVLGVVVPTALRAGPPCEAGVRRPGSRPKAGAKRRAGG